MSVIPHSSHSLTDFPLLFCLHSSVCVPLSFILFTFCWPSFLLCLLISMWVPLLVLPIFHLLNSLTVSAYQNVSAAPCLFCSLPANFSFALSLFASLWELPFVHQCLLTSFFLCLHLLGCEHLPCLFHLLSADSDFDCSLLDRLWVPIIVCPILYLLTSLLFKMWVLLLICAIFCLLPLILCFLTSLFLSPLLRMWVLPTLHFLLADHSPFYPCFPRSECCNFFISFSAC